MHYINDIIHNNLIDIWSRLQKHVNSVHNKVKNFACNLCDYLCAEKGSLKIHVRVSGCQDFSFEMNQIIGENAE